MTLKPKTEVPHSGASSAPAAPDPEKEAAERVKLLQERVQGLETELKILEGRAANRSPQKLSGLKLENEVMKERVNRLEKALFMLVQESLKARQVIDLKTQTEVLRLGAVEYCKRANINPEIWKNIVS